MRRSTILGICLVAVCGVIGMIASSASAALPTPVWAVCGKAPKTETKPKHFTGKYKNKTCTEKEESGEGKYEIVAGIGKGKAFKGTSGVARLDVQSPFGDDAVECKSGKGEGKPALPNRETDVSVTYKECELITLNSHTEGKCFTAGAKEGEMKVSGLAGELGYTEESPGVKVGLRLESEAAPEHEEEGKKIPGGVFVEFSCNEKVTKERPEKTPIVEGSKVAGEMIGEMVGFSGGANKETEYVLVGKEQYGTHEFDGKPYNPIVNTIGWASEQAGITAAEEANEEETDPAHVLKGEFCGPFVENALHTHCSPPAYAGLTSTTKNKGEALMIKT